MCTLDKDFYCPRLGGFMQLYGLFAIMVVSISALYLASHSFYPLASNLASHNARQARLMANAFVPYFSHCIKRATCSYYVPYEFDVKGVHIFAKLSMYKAPYKGQRYHILDISAKVGNTLSGYENRYARRIFLVDR